MTKLPETINVKVHSVTGKPETSLLEDIKNGSRSSGRTTALILKAIAEAQLAASGGIGNCIVEEKDYPHAYNARLMKDMADNIINDLGFRGFTVDVVKTNCDKPYEKAAHGIHIKFHTWTDAIYDLRK